MPKFAVAHLAANDENDADWAPLAANCLRQLGDAARDATLGFVYVTDAFADRLGELTAFLRERSGIADWVGSVGIGIVAGATEYYDRPAIAIMVAALPHDSFRLLATVAAPGPGDGTTQGWVARHAPAL